MSEIKCYFLTEIWPKSVSALSLIWVMKDILIKSLPYLPEALNRIFVNQALNPFKLLGIFFFPFSLAKTISITEYEHLHREGKPYLLSDSSSFLHSRKSCFFFQGHLFIFFVLLINRFQTN